MVVLLLLQKPIDCTATFSAIAGHCANGAIKAHETAVAQEEVNTVKAETMVGTKLLNNELEQQKLQAELMRQAEATLSMRNSRVIQLNKDIAQTKTNINRLIDRMMLLGKPTPEKTRLNVDLDDPDAKKDTGADINQRLSRRLELLQLTSDEERAIKQLEHERDDILKNINKTENATKRIQNRELLDQIFQVEKDAIRADFAQKRYDAYVKTLENIYAQADATAILTMEQRVLTDEVVKLADTINNEIITGIQGMIDGTKTLGDVMSSVLSKIADQMLRMAIMGESGSGGLFGSILKGIGGIFSGNPLGGFAPSLSRSFSDGPNLFDMDLGLPNFSDIPSGFSFAMVVMLTRSKIF